MILRTPRRTITGFLIFSTIVLLAGVLCVSFTRPGFTIADFLILALCFVSISLISLLIFLRGLKKEPQSQTMHLLVAIALKFLLELVLALMWFFVAKKTGPTFLILFFVLYLGFSVYLANLMLNTLKDRSL
jgi:hypothetical protein